MNPFIERRRFARIDAKMRVDGKSPDGDWSTEITGDISRGGMFLRTKEKLPMEVKNNLEIRVFLPGFKRGIEIRVRVIRHNAGGYGLKFLKIEPDMQEKLYDFIHKALGADDVAGRKDPRVYRRVEVRFNDPDELSKAYAENISKGGMFVVTPQRDIRVGNRISVVLLHPKTQREYRLPAEVVHIRPIVIAGIPRGQGLGVKFIEQDDAAKAELEVFVRELVLN